MGDLPGVDPVPWEEIIGAVTADNYGFLTTLNGCFAILLLHENSGEVWAISDRRAQQPLFSYASGNSAYVSTTASTFSRLLKPPTFDPRWLYETIYFNHQVLDRSFLVGVSRVPPATILTWKPGDRDFRYRQWTGPLSRPVKLVTGKEAAALEEKTFQKVAHDFFDDESRTAVALTAGFDARSALASAPRQSSDLLAYTYGVPGCADLRDAAKVAANLGVRHLAIELSDEFTSRLPELMVAAVRDSDGLERVLRAELLAAYPLIARMGRDISVGGVSGDHLFRDHLRGKGNVPDIISASMMNYIHGRGSGLEAYEFLKLFGSRYELFRDHILGCLKALGDRYGDVCSPEGYQRYLVYESAPKHFGGEAALASRYVLFRTIYWDPRLVELSFTTERATLGLSERLPEKDRFVETAAQAGVIAAGKCYGGGRIKGIRASTWARGNRTLYRVEDTMIRAARFVCNGFRRSRPAGLLSWPAWISGPAGPLCKELLGRDARLRNYLSESFLDTFEPTGDMRLASRLLSAELVLRLVEQRWPPDFRVNGTSRIAKS